MNKEIILLILQVISMILNNNGNNKNKEISQRLNTFGFSF